MVTPSSPLQDRQQEMLDLTRRLLKSIAEADWETYAELCDPSLTAFEPESAGQLVEGLEFHRFYFNLGPGAASRNTTMARPHVRMLGNDVAVVSYVRVVQSFTNAEGHKTVSCQETRVWQRQEGRWRHVHFHRS